MTPKDGVEPIKADPNRWILTPDEAVQRCRDLPESYEPRLHPLFGGLSPKLSADRAPATLRRIPVAKQA